MQEGVLKDGEGSLGEAERPVEPDQKEGHAVDRHEEAGQDIWREGLVQVVVAE